MDEQSIIEYTLAPEGVTHLRASQSPKTLCGQTTTDDWKPTIKTNHHKRPFCKDCFTRLQSFVFDLLHHGV